MQRSKACDALLLPTTEPLEGRACSKAGVAVRPVRPAETLPTVAGSTPTKPYRIGETAMNDVSSREAQLAR
tara:strand:+ start:543 stop:755 length:213 start_codon:yes stop_codon:yes gene_type:complete